MNIRSGHKFHRNFMMQSYKNTVSASSECLLDCPSQKTKFNKSGNTER